MKLLVITPYFYPKVGGLENYAWHICKGLKEKYDWDIVAVASNHEKNEYKEEIIEGVKIYRLPVWFKLSNTPINLGWFIDIFKIIKEEKPDVINGHTPVPFISDIGAIVSYLVKMPFILTYQNDLVKDNFLDIIFKLYYATLGNLTFFISKKIIVSNQYYADHSQFLKHVLKKVLVVSPGIYLPEKKKNVKIFPLSVLFVGQLDKTHIHKGLFYLIDALEIVVKKIKDSQLIIVGKGDYVNEYKEYIKSKSLVNNVTFLGYIDDNKLQEVYSAVNIVTLPSISQSEGFGMILIEAGSHKKPIIGSNVGGIPSIIKDGFNGYLVEPKNVEQLAEKISLLLTDKQLAKKLGENGYKEIIEKYVWELQVKKTEAIFI
ncbi:MAG TPA: glycosyltransferase family 4 protein [Candidatus Woesebacteria bacterium]|nr:glycosyltransferase family 4 protein [Candidatus Woesebacteria bacterium]